MRGGRDSGGRTPSSGDGRVWIQCVSEGLTLRLGEDFVILKVSESGWKEWDDEFWMRVTVTRFVLRKYTVLSVKN